MRIIHVSWTDANRRSLERGSTLEVDSRSASSPVGRELVIRDGLGPFIGAEPDDIE